LKQDQLAEGEQLHYSNCHKVNSTLFVDRLVVGGVDDMQVGNFEVDTGNFRTVTDYYFGNCCFEGIAVVNND
jgi:hypothetical protein